MNENFNIKSKIVLIKVVRIILLLKVSQILQKYRNILKKSPNLSQFHNFLQTIIRKNK